MGKSILRTITRLSKKGRAYISGELSKFNLTAAEQPVFIILRYAEGITQEELTSRVCIDKAATARTVKSLEEKGFLIRIQDEQDRRRNRLYLTESAKQMEPAFSDELIRFDELLTQGIDSQNLDIFYAVLQQMEENISRTESHKRAKTVKGAQGDEADK